MSIHLPKAYPSAIFPCATISVSVTWVTDGYFAECFTYGETFTYATKVQSRWVWENQHAGQDVVSSFRSAGPRTAQSTWRPSPVPACQGDEAQLARPETM